MRNYLLIAGAAILGLAVACVDPAKAPVPVANSPQVVPAADSEQHDDAPRITLADAKKDYDVDSAVFFDVRSEDAYKQEHIKGAINLSQGILDKHLEKLPKNKKIIAYCS
ncbi:MAG: rhodanese-like domain-containing protein [Acidobacteriota bacterium]